MCEKFGVSIAGEEVNAFFSVAASTGKHSTSSREKNHCFQYVYWFVLFYFFFTLKKLSCRENFIFYFSNFEIRSYWYAAHIPTIRLLTFRTKRCRRLYGLLQWFFFCVCKNFLDVLDHRVSCRTFPVKRRVHRDVMTDFFEYRTNGRKRRWQLQTHIGNVYFYNCQSSEMLTGKSCVMYTPCIVQNRIESSVGPGRKSCLSYRMYFWKRFIWKKHT